MSLVQALLLEDTQLNEKINEVLIYNSLPTMLLITLTCEYHRQRSNTFIKTVNYYRDPRHSVAYLYRNLINLQLPRPANYIASSRIPLNE